MKKIIYKNQTIWVYYSFNLPLEYDLYLVYIYLLIFNFFYNIIFYLLK